MCRGCCLLLVRLLCVFVLLGAILALWLALLLPFHGAPAPAPISTITQQLNTALAASTNNAPVTAPSGLMSSSGAGMAPVGVPASFSSGAGMPPVSVPAGYSGGAGMPPVPASGIISSVADTISAGVSYGMGAGGPPRLFFF